MLRSASPHQRMILITVVAGVVLLAALWMLAIAPKRSESAEVQVNVLAQEARLDAATSVLATYEASREQYPKTLAELRRLDEAVPARGAIPSLLRQLQRRAQARKSDLLLAALKPAALAPGTGLTPGAAPAAAGGIATLPFTFTYKGEYFDLVKVLAEARRAVTVKSAGLKIDGRLVTIEGLSFQRSEPESALITASVSGTAYIAANTATPPQPTAAPAAAPTQGGS